MTMQAAIAAALLLAGVPVFAQQVPNRPMSLIRAMVDCTTHDKSYRVAIQDNQGSWVPRTHHYQGDLRSEKAGGERTLVTFRDTDSVIGYSGSDQATDNGRFTVTINRDDYKGSLVLGHGDSGNVILKVDMTTINGDIHFLDESMVCTEFTKF